MRRTVRMVAMSLWVAAAAPLACADDAPEWAPRMTVAVALPEHSPAVPPDAEDLQPDLEPPPALTLRSGIGTLGNAGAGLRLHSVVVQRWFGEGSTQFGVGLGAMQVQRLWGPLPPSSPVALYNLSVQHRLASQGQLSFDLWSSQQLSHPDGRDYVTAGWNVEYRPTPQSGFGFSRGGVHFRFDAHSLMSLRLRGGGARLYYRVQF
jgi:hypothetical protein